MAALYLVDTSAWIFALRPRPREAIQRRIDLLLDQDAVATCGLVELELLGGARSEAEFTRLMMRLRGLHRLGTEDLDWREAARLCFDLRRIGITIPFTDALLSALAIRYAAVLMHADRDFDLIAAHCPLQVESLVDMVA